MYLHRGVLLSENKKGEQETTGNSVSQKTNIETISHIFLEQQAWL